MAMESVNDLYLKKKDITQGIEKVLNQYANLTELLDDVNKYIKLGKAIPMVRTEKGYRKSLYLISQFIGKDLLFCSKHRDEDYLGYYRENKYKIDGIICSSNKLYDEYEGTLKFTYLYVLRDNIVIYLRESIIGSPISSRKLVSHISSRSKILKIGGEEYVNWRNKVWKGSIMIPLDNFKKNHQFINWPTENPLEVKE